MPKYIPVNIKIYIYRKNLVFIDDKCSKDLELLITKYETVIYSKNKE